MISRTAIALAALACTASGAAIAQKSADNVRLAMSEPISVIDAYHNLQRENNIFSDQVFDTLITYNQIEQSFTPQLAKSWKRVGDRAIEFEMREDVKFHNGNTVDADDVVYTVNWLIDPKSKLQSAQRYNWMAGAEKLGPFKVRINEVEPMAADLLNLANTISIYDSQVHQPLTDKFEYGRAPIGSGPFRIASLDSNKGIVAVRHDGYVHGSKARVKSVHGMPVPDRSVQLAHMLTGSLDAIYDPSEDHLKELKGNPSLGTTSFESFSMLYIQLDSINRSGHKELTDSRVRKALYMAIDRKELVSSLISGGASAKIMDAMCFKEMLACDWSAKPVGYDPAGAKKLLEEAGYPNGFDLALTARPVTKDAAVAIVGYWRKIGINATVDLVTLNAFTSKRSSGQLAAYFGERPYASYPDAGYALDVNFANESRDYWRDALLHKAIKDGAGERDEAKRKAIYRQAFDHVTNQFYMFPISSLPQTWVHHKDLSITASAGKPFTAGIDQFQWK